jgi:hypothetical protein
MKAHDWMAKVGFDASAAHQEKVVVKRGESVWVSPRQEVQGALRPTVRTVETPEEYRSLVALAQGPTPMIPDGVQGCHVDNVSGDAAAKLKNARTEAVYFTYGGQAMSADARDEIVKRYFPLQVAMGAYPDVEINTGGQFVIDGGVGSYHFGTVKIHQGGNFIVYSNASIVIDDLQKLPPN